MSLDFTKLTYVDGETVIPASNLNEIQEAILDLDSNKVEKEQGKGLSTNDYTNEEKAKVSAASQATQETTLGPSAIATFDASAPDMPLKSLVVNIEPVQSGSGDPSPENVRPITGRTGVKATHYGANLLDGVSINRGVYVTPSGGEQTSATGFSSTDYVPINDDVSILTNFPSRLTSAISVAYYNASKVFISRQFVYGNDGQFPPVGPASEKLRLPADAEWLRVNCYYNEFAHVAISDGDIDNINITFPAGTVYGGTLDAVNGKLTVEWVKADLGQMNFVKVTASYGYASAYTPLKKAGTTNIIAEELKTINASSALSMPDYSIKGRESDGTIFVRTLADMTQEELRTWLSGKCVVYELAEPLVYDLTNIPEITTLLGTNNIWADTGDISVTYGAYLETVKAHAERLGDSILSAIASLEASYTASRVYAVGEFLFVGTQFYKVTAAIGSGDTINPDTNVTQTTVAAQLMALAGN